MIFAEESTCTNAMGTSAAVVVDTAIDCPVLQTLATCSTKNSVTWLFQIVKV